MALIKIISFKGVGVGTKPINTEGIYVSKNNIKTLWAQYGLPILRMQVL